MSYIVYMVLVQYFQSNRHSVVDLTTVMFNNVACTKRRWSDIQHLTAFCDLLDKNYKQQFLNYFFFYLLNKIYTQQFVIALCDLVKKSYSALCDLLDNSYTQLTVIY